MLDKRLLVIEEEFVRVLRVGSRDGNILSSVIRDAWDGKTLRGLSKTSPSKASGAHISIIGHITREELLANLAQGDATNGVGNRFLWGPPGARSCCRSAATRRSSTPSRGDFTTFSMPRGRTIRSASTLRPARVGEKSTRAVQRT